MIQASIYRHLRSNVGAALRKLLMRRNLALVPADSLHAAAFVKGQYDRLGIDLLLDGGANNGSTGREFRAAGYAGRIVSFEPQAAVFAELRAAAQNDPHWHCRQVALGDTDGVVSMEVSGAPVSSSLLPMREEHVRVWPESRPVGREDVPVVRLDSLAAELGVANHQTLLKLDVQGYESAVLRGAAGTLPVIKAVLVELLFAPLYEGQARYFEVMATLDAAGLRFAGLFDTYLDSQTNLPVFANGLFVRGSNNSRPQATPTP
jgi:FkbM family methyltransferase